MTSKKNRSFQENIIRYCLCFLGIAFITLGITIVTKSDLGTTPVTSLPYVASLGTSFSLGFYTTLLNLLCFASQILIMKEKFPKEQFFQLPLLIVFGLLLDFWMWLIPFAESISYTNSIIFLALGITVMALGIFIEVDADVVLMPVDGFVVVLSMVLGKNFGTLKIFFDSAMLILALILSFYLFGKVKGLREGTIIASLSTGMVVSLFYKLKSKILEKRIEEEDFI